MSMWIPGTDIKALVDGYLTTIKLADEKKNSPEPKWPCWEMNNHLLDASGNSRNHVNRLFFGGFKRILLYILRYMQHNI